MIMLSLNKIEKKLPHFQISLKTIAPSEVERAVQFDLELEDEILDYLIPLSISSHYIHTQR